MEMSPHPLTEFIHKGYMKRKLVNRLICMLLALAAIGALFPLFIVIKYVLGQGWPSIHLDFFTQLPKPVGESGGGMANALAGTALLVLLASWVGIPWGIAAGIYLAEYGRGKFSETVRLSADLLSSIPSIVIGLFVYALLVLPMKRFSALAGGVALGILMIPTVARTSEELLRRVPFHIREAGLALGLPRWKVIGFIVLKGSLKGITTGIMISIARVAGETAPLLFTAFNNRFWGSNLDQPIASLPVQIYTYAVSPFEDWHRQAWAGALILVAFVFALNILTRVTLRSAKGTESE